MKPSVCSEGPLHPLRETPSGPAIVPTNFPLYLGLFFAPFIPIAWYFTKDLDLDAGLKLAAWLLPLFAAAGSLVGWAVLHVLASRFIFNDIQRRLEFRGLRFSGQNQRIAANGGRTSRPASDCKQCIALALGGAGGRGWWSREATGRREGPRSFLLRF